MNWTLIITVGVGVAFSVLVVLVCALIMAGRQDRMFDELFGADPEGEEPDDLGNPWPYDLGNEPAGPPCGHCGEPNDNGCVICDICCEEMDVEDYDFEADDRNYDASKGA